MNWLLLYRPQNLAKPRKWFAMFPQSASPVNRALPDSNATHGLEPVSKEGDNGEQVFIASLLLNLREGERCQRGFRVFL